VEKPPLVYVIILNWNRCADTLECLESITRQRYPNYQVVVVDNGSQDDSVETIQKQYPQVFIIANSRNLGFATGNNQGIQYSLEAGADYLLLINNDTVSDRGLLDELVDASQSDDKVGIAGSKILYYNDPERLWSAGCKIDYSETISRHRGYRKLDRGRYDLAEEVEAVSGCAMLLKRIAIEKTGLLDEAFSPVYYEDLDMCVRVRKHGFKVVFVPSARIWHKVSSSSGGEYNPIARYYLGYNSIKFIKRHANIFQKVKYLLYTMSSIPFVWLFRAFRGEGRGCLSKALGILDGLTGTQRNFLIG
jgi:GT2 family glycosyltransferase